eukprot:11647449-Alexandrium_andersonii.AAC.1
MKRPPCLAQGALVVCCSWPGATRIFVRSPALKVRLVGAETNPSPTAASVPSPQHARRGAER